MVVVIFNRIMQTSFKFLGVERKCRTIFSFHGTITVMDG